MLGYQAENKGTDLKKSQLQAILETYFKDVPDLADMENTDILNTELETQTKYGAHSITVKEIFDGKLLGDNQIKAATADEINAKIGTVVDGYSAKDLEWQVYYADEDETFLISKTLAKTNFSVPIKGINNENDYSGSEDVRNTTYGAKWNKQWLDVCTSTFEQGAEHAEAVAYLCDPDNWVEYKIGSANYAAGGPTYELLIESWNKSHDSNLYIPDEDTNVVGYSYIYPSEFGIYNCEVKQEVCNGIYNNGNDYWIASPCKMNYPSFRLKCLHAEEEYIYIGEERTKGNIGIRPIVSIPTSKIGINGDTVTILNK